MIDKINFIDKSGKIYTIDNTETIKKIVSLLPKNIQWSISTDKRTLQKKYYYLVETLRVNTDAKNSYSKSEFHNAIKEKVFFNLKDRPDLFTDEKVSFSTTKLNIEGLSYLIDSLKNFAIDFYGYTL